MRSIEKQRACVEGLKAKEVDMCGVVETGVNEGQVVEGGRYYNWYGSGRQ